MSRRVLVAKSFSAFVAMVALVVSGYSDALAQSERKLAPDALNVIRPSIEFGETFQGPVDLPLAAQHPELQWKPNYAPESDTLLELSKKVTFRNTVYGFEFAFKPVRIMEVDLPTASGSEKQLVWYLVYRVTYRGNDYKPTIEKDQFNNEIYGKPSAVSAKTVRFMPNFHLVTKGLKSALNAKDQRLLDKVLPQAVNRIATEERISTLYDSLSIQQLGMEVGQSVWGVATWIGVDPNTDFFTVEVKGLTNAQHIELEGGKLKYSQKVLVLNFFRPGDTVNLTTDRIQYGVPAVNRLAGLKKELAKVLSNREARNKERVFDYELAIVGGLENSGDVSKEVMAVAQAIQQLGGEQIQTYSQTGSILFSMRNAESKDTTIEAAIKRNLGLEVDVFDRATRLSQVIEEAEAAKDESRQTYILKQYGLKERLDHFWVYR
ncbi:MAG: DUF1697 domain-containing protein [Pirellulales bacterium]